MATERCACGHNREAHPLYYGICSCGITRLSNGQDAPNGNCMGWTPTVKPADPKVEMGERCGCSFSTLPGKQLRCAETTRHQGPHHADGVTWPQLFPKQSEEVPNARRHLGLEGRAPATTAAPTDIRQAIQAGMQAMMLGIGDEVYRPYDRLAKLAVEAAWPRAALAELAVLRHSTAQMRDLTREQDQTIRALRDKVADLEVHAAEVHDLLRELHERGPTRALHAKITAALATQPPQHRRQLLDKVERLEQENEQLKTALAEFVPLHPEKFRPVTALDQGEAQPRQLLGYQTSDGRLYQPEDITLVYTLDQGETQLLDRVEQVADERDHFQAGMHRMREALTGLRQGRMTGEQANDEFFDGYQQAKQAFAVALLVRDVKATTLDQGETQGGDHGG